MAAHRIAHLAQVLAVAFAAAGGAFLAASLAMLGPEPAAPIGVLLVVAAGVPSIRSCEREPAD